MKKNSAYQSVAVLALAGAFALPLSPASAEILNFTANLKSSEVVPAPTVQQPPKTLSAGTATADITFDTATKKMTWEISYNGLTGPATSVKFHSPAEPAHIAPPTIILYGSLSNPIKDDTVRQAVTITPAMEDALKTGKMYLDIATTAQPLGEIRGQVLPKK